MSAFGESVVRRTSAPPDAGAGAKPDLVVQDHCIKADCGRNSRIWDTGIDFPLDHGARKTAEDNCRELGTQDWSKEKPSCDKVSTSVDGDHWPGPEAKPQGCNGAFHSVGMLKKAIIVTTSIEQTTRPRTGSMAISNIQTDIKAMHPTNPHDNISSLPSLDLGSPDLLFGSHALGAVGVSSGQTKGSAPSSELQGVPTNPPNEHAAGNSDKNRELAISSGIKGPQNVVPFQGMSLAWHMPDAAGGLRGTGLAIYPKPSSCNDVDETGLVEVVSSVLSAQIEGLGRESGRPVDASEA